MSLSEHQKIEKYAKKCGHCSRNNLLPYEYEWTCISSGYNVKNENLNFQKYNEKDKFYK